MPKNSGWRKIGLAVKYQKRCLTEGPLPSVACRKHFGDSRLVKTLASLALERNPPPGGHTYSAGRVVNTPVKSTGKGIHSRSLRKLRVELREAPRHRRPPTADDDVDVNEDEADDDDVDDDEVDDGTDPRTTGDDDDDDDDDDKEENDDDDDSEDREHDNDDGKDDVENQWKMP